MADTLGASIDGQIRDVQAYITSLDATMQGLTDNLEDLTEPERLPDRLGYGSFGIIDPITYDPSSIASESGTVPVFTGVAPDGNLELASIPAVHAGNFTEVTTSPTVNDITIEDINVPDAPTAPSLSYDALPDEPAYTLPTAPTLGDITIPAAPEFFTPAAFSGTLPSDLTAPELPSFDFTEEAFDYALEDQAVAWLEDKIGNGITGLDVTVEQAIFDRELTREVEAARRNLENAIDEFAPGFARPSGALRARTDALRADLQGRVEDLNRKIAEDQGRLAQTNQIFTITEALKHSAIRLANHNQIMDRGLQYAKAIVDSALSVYGLKVTEYQARIEGYKAEAQVYGDLVRASLVEVEKYKAEVDASLGEVEVQKAQIAKYEAEVSAVKTIADFYSIRLQGYKTKADIELSKLEVFRTQVQAFEVGVRADAYKYEAARAKIDLEGLHLKTYEAEVSAITHKNDTELQRVQSELAVAGGIMAQNGKLIDNHRANIEGYKASVSAYQAQVQGYTGSIETRATEARVAIENARNSSLISIENAKIQFEVAKASVLATNKRFEEELNFEIVREKGKISGAVSGLGHFASVASAALSQINTISQIESYEDVTP